MTSPSTTITTAPGAVPGAGAPVIGVLALQGDVREHLTALARRG